MKRPVLVRRREVWFPTVWGWFLLLIIAALALLLAGRNIYAFLAPNHLSGARLMIVEGWMAPRELDRSLEMFRSNGYTRVITTGGPVEPGLDHVGQISYANLARDYLVLHGIPENQVTAVPTPHSDQDRTYLSALMVREWLAHAQIAADALDVVSSGVHSRRSWLLYRTAFGPRVSVGIIAAPPTAYDPDAWWTTSTGAKVVVSEALNWLWTEIFFRPGAPDSPS